MHLPFFFYYSNNLFFFSFLKIFNWLQWVLAVAHRIFDLCCGVEDLLVVACRIEFSDQELKLFPLHWELSVLATGPPGKSQNEFFLKLSQSKRNLRKFHSLYF